MATDRNTTGNPLWACAVALAAVTTAWGLDVLEHVPNDVALLREYSDKAERGARFFISVPAFEFLWSGHDVFLEHYRRYTLRQVRDVVQRAGLKIDRASYYSGPCFRLPRQPAWPAA